MLCDVKVSVRQRLMSANAMYSPELDKNLENKKEKPPDHGGTGPFPTVTENLMDSDVDIPDESARRKRKKSGEGESSASRIRLENNQGSSEENQTPCTENLADLQKWSMLRKIRVYKILRTKIIPEPEPW